MGAMKKSPRLSDLTPTTQSPPQISTWLFGLVCIATGIQGIDRQLLGVLAEPIKHELGLSDTAIGALTGTVFAFSYALASFPLARISDSGIRRSILAYCLGFWSIMTSFCGIAQTGLQLGLARIGVAVGEAGNLPISVSLVDSGRFAGKSATAMSFLLACQGLGVALGLLLGAWLASLLGWRLAFVILGLPGILVAILIRFTTDEPARTFVGEVEQSGKPTGTGLGVLLRTPTFWCAAVAITLMSLAGLGLVLWMPSFFSRVHGMELGHVGGALALVMGTITVVGSLISGRLSDILSKHDIRWYAWFPTLAALVIAPLVALFASTSNTNLAVGLFAGIIFVANLTYPPIWALALSVSQPYMRSTVAACLTICVNGGGLGAGPLLIGVLNDHFKAHFGTESIRYSVFSLVVVFLAAAIALGSGGLFIGRDRRRQKHSDDLNLAKEALQHAE
jgi:predicted MFS family arabinose efflux permease